MAKGSRGSKPGKPRRDFPLFPMGNGQWCKKIRGKPHYFGPWADPVAAEKLFDSQKEDLFAGRVPAVADLAGEQLGDLCNVFLALKQERVASGELNARSFRNYKATTDLIVGHFGRGKLVASLTPRDFQGLRQFFAKGRGLVSVGNHIRHTRILFRFAEESDFIGKPLKFGPGFESPKPETLRKLRQQNPLRMFEAAEIRSLLAEANPVIRAMILLAINCGFGQTDSASLPEAALDLAGGWVNFPRPKTAVPRRATLWAETVKAIRDVMDRKRPTPKDMSNAGLLFITREGERFVRHNEKGTNFDAVAGAFAKLLVKARIDKGRGFYALRHTFQTIADGARDPVAVQSIMGHAPSANDMSAVCRERIEDDRLQAVAKFVRSWLFPNLKGTRAKNGRQFDAHRRDGSGRAPWRLRDIR